MKIQNRKNVATGLLFLFIGVGTLWISSSYPLGSASSMGPGYFPTILGTILCVLSLILFGDGLKREDAEDEFLTWNFAPLLIITVAVILFAVLLEPAGLVLSTMIMVFVSGLASPRSKLVTNIISAVLLAAITVAIFSFALGLNIPILPKIIG